MGAVRKVTSVSTLGLVKFSSKQEKAAQASRARARYAPPNPYQQQAAAAAWQQHQVNMQLAQQQVQMNQVQLAQQQDAARRAWEAQQPLGCQHCHQLSAPSSATCQNCGSRSLSIAYPQQQRPQAPAPQTGGGWADRAKAAPQAKAAEKLGLQRP